MKLAPLLVPAMLFALSHTTASATDWNIAPGDPVQAVFDQLQPNDTVTFLTGLHSLPPPDLDDLLHSNGNHPYLILTANDVTISFDPGAYLQVEKPSWGTELPEGDPLPPGYTRIFSHPAYLLRLADRFYTPSQENATAHNITMIGIPNQVELLGWGKTYIYAPDTSGSSIWHLFYTGGIHTAGADNITVEHIGIANLGVDGIEVTSGPGETEANNSSNIEIRHCTFDSLVRTAVGVTSAENVLVYHCTASNINGFDTAGKPIATAAYHVEPSDADPDAHVHNIRIENCEAADIDKGIACEGKAKTDELWIKDNTIADARLIGISVRGADQWAIDGNDIDASLHPTSFVINIETVGRHPLGTGTVTNNRGVGGQIGIRVIRNQFDPSWGQLLLEGNHISGCAEDGIRLSEGREIWCSRNYIEDATQCGIHLKGSAPDKGRVILSENEIRDCLGCGVKLIGTTADYAEDLFLTSNYIVAGSGAVGARIEYCNKVRMIYNQIEVPAGATGLEIQDATDVVVRHCECVGAGNCGDCVSP